MRAGGQGCASAEPFSSWMAVRWFLKQSPDTATAEDIRWFSFIFPSRA
jgi:hypothetical protein